MKIKYFQTLKNKSTETVNEKIVSLFISRISPFCSYICNRKNNEKQDMKVIQDFENAMTNNFLLKIFTNFSKTNNYRRPFKSGLLSCTENILPKTASHFHSAKSYCSQVFGRNILKGRERKGIGAFLFCVGFGSLVCLFNLISKPHPNLGCNCKSCAEYIKSQFEKKKFKYLKKNVVYI